MEDIVLHRIHHFSDVCVDIYWLLQNGIFGKRLLGLIMVLPGCSPRDQVTEIRDIIFCLNSRAKVVPRVASCELPGPVGEGLLERGW
jgi:hypothetical protein